MMKSANCQHGYTLIELLLYISILGSLLLGISMYFVTSTTARAKNQSIAEVDRQGALALEYITQTIRNADSITSPTAGNSANALTIVVPTGALSPTIFDLNSGNLRVKEGAAAQIALHNSKVQVTSLTFTNLTRSGTPGVVRVSFVLSRLNPNNRNEYSYQKTFTGTAALR